MPEVASIGKYCPNCNLMTALAEEKCRRCGHQFRTGKPNLQQPEAGDVDPLNKTQMFMRSPIYTSAIYTLPEAPNQSAGHQPESVANKRKQIVRAQWWKFAASGLLLSTVVLLGWFLWLHAQKPPQYPLTVVGTWASCAPSARMDLKFLANGSGVFSWMNNSPSQATATIRNIAIDRAAPSSGQTPLRWRQDKAHCLIIAIQPSAAAGTVPRTLIEALNSRPWEWHIDSATNILKVGPLPFKRTNSVP